MTKQFFVIITYSPIEVGGGGLGFFNKKSNSKEKLFEENQGQLQQRVGFIQNNIRSLGLRAVQLGTEEDGTAVSDIQPGRYTDTAGGIIEVSMSMLDKLKKKRDEDELSFIPKGDFEQASIGLRDVIAPAAYSKHLSLIHI